MNDDPIIGADLHMYVGDFGTTTKLKRVLATHTGGVKLANKVPANWEAWVDGDAQSGMVQHVIQMGFETLDERVMKMQAGVSISAADDSWFAPTTFQKYSMLFIHPREDLKVNIWLPKVQTLVDPSLEYSKLAPTEVTGLIFRYLTRNRFQRFTYLDTAAALKILVGNDRWPIT